jgi:predicted membrane protein
MCTGFPANAKDYLVCGCPSIALARAVLMLWQAFLFLGPMFFIPFSLLAWWSALLFLVRILIRN